MLQSGPSERFVVPLTEVGQADVSLVGGKGANLGELTRAGIPVPAGFIITGAAYDRLLGVAGIRPQTELLFAHLDVSDTASVERVADEMRDLIINAQLPEEMASAIGSAYQQIGSGPVAVRSSATAEDLAEASFAGQQDTYLNVDGEVHVLRAVQNCWASLFQARAVHYRAVGGFGQLDVKMAVVIQRMVQSDRSGVIFTVNPVTNDQSKILIEAVYGLGEGVVSGILTPDMYVVDKRSGIVLDRQVIPQEQELVRHTDANPDEDFNQWVSVEWSRRARQKLSDAEIGELAAMGQRLEQHFGCPQDIEWASEDEIFYIVQARPVTGLH